MKLERNKIIYTKEEKLIIAKYESDLKKLIEDYNNNSPIAARYNYIMDLSNQLEYGNIINSFDEKLHKTQVNFNKETIKKSSKKNVK